MKMRQALTENIKRTEGFSSEGLPTTNPTNAFGFATLAVEPFFSGSASY